MRTLVLSSLALVALAVGGPASAADMPVKAPAYVPPSWTGFYIGINGGGGWQRVDTSAIDIGPDGFFAFANQGAVMAGTSRHFTGSGGLAGGQIGYLYQSGSIITGLEASFDWSSLSSSTSFGPTPYPVTPGSTFAWNLKGQSDWLATFTGRVGPDMGWWYPYVTGGLAVTHLKYSANFIDTFYPTNNTFNFNRDALGWVIGAGAEMRAWQNWLLRIEYLHMDFAHAGGVGLISCNSPGVGNCAAGGNTTNFLFNSHFSEDIVRAALSYKF